MALPIGPQHVTANQQVPYVIHVSLLPGTSIVWIVNGGIILSGQGTSQIVVQWTIVGQGSVQVSVNHPGQDQETDSITVIIDPEH